MPNNPELNPDEVQAQIHDAVERLRKKLSTPEGVGDSETDAEKAADSEGGHVEPGG